MTRNEFQTLCEDISYEEGNENWESHVVLNRIAGLIGNVVLNFKMDADNLPEFGESNPNA